MLKPDDGGDCEANCSENVQRAVRLRDVSNKECDREEIPLPSSMIDGESDSDDVEFSTLRSLDNKSGPCSAPTTASMFKLEATNMAKRYFVYGMFCN